MSEDFPRDSEGFMIVEPDDFVWGKVRLDFCTRCFLTHEFANIYTITDNPMDARPFGELWLCDDDDDEEWDEDE